MKKNGLFLLCSSLLLAAPAWAAAESNQYYGSDSLPELMQRDVMLRPHVKDLVANASFPDKTKLLRNIESPPSFKLMNFKELTQGFFGENAWVPQIHAFSNSSLQELFLPYSSKLSIDDGYVIFHANVFYESGRKIYTMKGNSVFLERAASIGHARAQYKMFLVDFKLGKLEEAKNYLFCSAAQGNPEALLTLSEAYQGFWGTIAPKELNTAELLCQEAAILGNQGAKFRIEVSTFIEGFFNHKKNYQQGIRNAKALADNNNQHALRFIGAIMESSSDALQEGNETITDKDINFLKEFLGWEDATDEDEADEKLEADIANSLDD